MAVPITAPRNELVTARSSEFRIERWNVAFVKTFPIHSKLCFSTPPMLPTRRANVGISSNIRQKIRNGAKARRSPIRLQVRPDMSAASLDRARAEPAWDAGRPRHPVGGGDGIPAGGGEHGQAPTSIVQSVARRAIASAAAFQSLIGLTASYWDASGNLAAMSAGICRPWTSGR